MAQITPRRNGEFLRVIFSFLMNDSEGVQAKDILSYVEKNIAFTEFEQGHYDSDPESPRAHKIIRFATIPAVKAGWLIKGKGIWRITEAGQLAFERYKDPEEFYRQAKRRYQEWRSSRP